MARQLRRHARSVAWVVRNAIAGRRLRREVLGSDRPIGDLSRYERRFRSQNGEDGILEALVALVGAPAKTFVEFGAGARCNTMSLAQRGWKGLWMDPRGPWRDAPYPVHREFVTVENVEALFARHGAAPDLDVLSIDVDGNDWWIWRAIESRRPRIVAIEYNAHVGPEASVVIPYAPTFAWNGSDYHGASLLALARLAAAKRYALVGCDSSGTNAFFVAREHLPPRLRETSVEQAWRPAASRKRRHWVHDERAWRTVHPDASVT